MALWANSAIDEVKLAMTFNQMLTKQTTSLVSKQCGFLYAMTGGKHPAMPPKSFNFRRHTKTSGVAVEWRMMGKTNTLSTVADGAPELGALVLTYDDTIWGNATLTIPQLRMNHPITESDIERIRGSEAKTNSYMDEVAAYLKVSWQRGLNVKLAANAAADIVGVPYAIDNANVYATIDRSDPANAQFQGKVLDLAGASLSYAHLIERYNTCAIEGGRPWVVFLPLALYNSIQTEVQSFVHTTYDPVWDKFGGEFIKVGNMVLVLEPDLAATTVIGMDPSTWYPIFGQGDGSSPFRTKIILPENQMVTIASGAFRTWAFIQLVCVQPRFNFKIINAAP